ncbi:hypothetical protein LZ198_41125 [Myxococcus sp. K15C18031901]|uniref:hypothetical protein n=1 Tax=Myxococcus dinghuensis TaxID=2906761 RepID=UPI0020A7E3CD|nr:hypothetical protein [Myxococcus dinghuensis]MCP3105291.1 hypothetical protein [Myxococcus dinghuensis]
MWPLVLSVLLGTSQPEPAMAPSAAEIGEVSSFEEATQGWREDPVLDLTETILRSGTAPAFEKRDGGVCVDIGLWWGKSADGEDEKHWVWVSCPPPSTGSVSSGPCEKLISTVTDLAVLGERCSKAAVAYAELELAGCGQGEKDFVSLLRRSASMRIHHPKDTIPGIQELRKQYKIGGSPGKAERMNCVESISSPDGRVRIWVVHVALQVGAPPFDEMTYRPLAYLQWLTPEGQLRLDINGVREDFFLDTLLDEVVPVPDKPHEYLVTGYRPLRFIYHRFAEVISLAGPHPTRVKGRFLVDGQPEDVLLFTGGRPDTGKPRHSRVYVHWLRLKGRRLWVEPIPRSSFYRHQVKPFVLGEWTGEAFAMKERGWAWFSKLRGTHLLPGRLDEPTPPERED